MYDVLIAGYGPTGMLAAALLGRAGHRVGVFERYKTLYNLPRVGIVHDDVLRMFQEIGCIDRIWPSTYFLPVFDLAKHGQVLLSSDVAPNATHGWPEYISLYQPVFEGELDAICKALPSVNVFQGERVVSVTQNSETIGAPGPASGTGVSPQVADSSGSVTTFNRAHSKAWVNTTTSAASASARARRAAARVALASRSVVEVMAQA